MSGTDSFISGCLAVWQCCVPRCESAFVKPWSLLSPAAKFVLSPFPITLDPSIQPSGDLVPSYPTGSDLAARLVGSLRLAGHNAVMIGHCGEITWRSAMRLLELRR